MYETVSAECTRQRVKRVLLLEREPAGGLGKLLEQSGQFTVKRVDPDDAGIERLDGGRFDVVVVPDYGRKMNAEEVEHVCHTFGDTPVVVLGEEQGDAGMRLLRMGVQDFLSQRDLNGEQLKRSLDFAIARFATAQHQRAEEEAVPSAAMGAVLNRVPIGILMLNTRGRVIFRNRCADQILADVRHWVFVDDIGRLRSVATRSGPHLEYFAREVLTAKAGEEPSFAVAFPDGRGGLGLEVVITAVGSHPRRHGAVVFMSEPARPIEVSTQALIDIYGLSAAEARVVAALAKASRAEEVADKLFLSINTVRTHIKQAYRKTNTSNQSELIKLVLTGPALVAARQREAGDRS